MITDQPYDLVVSDIKMPGLCGLDLLRAVKGKQPGTPVVLITGNPSVNSAVFGLRHGAYDYLPKPFSVREMQELLAPHPGATARSGTARCRCRPDSPRSWRGGRRAWR